MVNFTQSLKKSILSLTVVALALLVTNRVNAQVSLYTFTQSSGTFTAIPSPTTVHASGWDDAATSITIPFTFTFNGVGYTSCSVNSNGYVTFGATVSTTTGYTPISAATGYSGAISAFGRDLISNATTITYGTDGGTTPNRVFIIQWNGARRYSLGAITGDVLNFQIRLYETSNKAEVRYGTCTATNATAYTCQVGLRGATNTDYNNRTSSTAWASTTAGGANSATVTSSNTIMPASGLTFTWTPLPAAPANPTITAGPNCATGATLTASGSAPSGVTWYWQGTNATGTSTASPASSTYNAAGNGTYYIRAQNNTTLAWSVSSGSVVVTFPAGPAAPAAPTGTSPACVSTTLTAGAAAGGTTNYWQGTTANGTSTATNASSTYPVSASGTYYLNARDNTTLCWSVDASKAVVINALPAAPTAPVGSTVCIGAATANVSATGAAGPTGSFTQTISFTVAGQPTETNAAPGNTVASAAFTALPSGSTVTSATLVYNNITALASSWQADVRLGLGSAITDAALVGTGAANAAGVFNYTRALPAGTLTAIASAASGTVNLLYWDALSDNAGAEATFPTGAGVATLTINYTAPSVLAVQWYDAATIGTLQGTGNPYNTIGSTVLPTAGTPGTYSFYGGSVNAAGCKSATRVQADVIVNPVIGTITPINLTCNGIANGSFSFAATCGTAPFTYKVDGVGAFGAIPTNLAAGSHSVIVKDNAGFSSASINFTLTEPAAVAPPTLPVGASACLGANPINISATGSPTGPVGPFTQTISFTVAGQPVETQATPGNVVASAAFTALPSGATVTSATLTFNGITALGGSWQADVRLGLGTAITDVALGGTGAANAAGVFNYTRTLGAATLTAIASAASGTVNLLYWDNVSDNAGAEATFPTGAGVATLTINYTAPSPLAVQWYDAATIGNLQGIGNPFNTFGSALVGAALTPGTYSFYGGSVNASGCKSATRVKADVVISGTSVVLTGNNLTCFGAGNGSISLTSVICGTAPLSYSINGAGYVSSLPTNLAAGSYTVLVKDATNAVSSPYTVVITQPAVVADPTSATGVNVCTGVLTANLTAVAGGSGTQTVSFTVSGQPTETNAAPGNLVASAAFTAIPAGSTVTSATLIYSNITIIGTTEWLSDVRLGFSGAITDAAAQSDGAPGSNAATLNYSRALSGAALTAIQAAASGTLNLLYWDYFNDNAGAEVTFPTGTAVATLVITYTSGNTIRWYDASTGGNLVGSGSPFNAVGTTVLPNTSTPGTYNFFAASYNGTCNSTNRLPANVNVTTVSAPLTAVNVTCNGYANGTFTRGTVVCGTTPFTYSVNGGTFGPIPTNLGPGTYSVIIKDFNGNTAPSTNIVITEPAAETTAPTAAVNATVCKGATSASVSVTPGLWAPVQILYSVANQTVTSAPVNFNITIPNLGASATVTNTYLYLQNVVALAASTSWLSDLRIGLTGATTLATSSLSASNTSGTLTPNPGTVALPNITNAGGVVSVTLSESADDVGDDATWGTVGILVYANNVNAPVSWWTAATGGTQIGTGATFDPYGTAGLPNTNTPGVYTIYAQADGITACANISRLPVTITVIAPATANAGSAAATICSNTPHTVSGATATQYSSIVWTKTGGTGTLTNATTLAPTYTPSVGESGSVVLTLTAYGNTPCSNATDTKTLTIVAAPTVTITAPTGATTCSNVPFTVTDASATNYVSLNWTDNGIGTFTANQTALNPTYTPNIIQSGTTTLVLHVNANAPCADITASKDLVITTRPTANAGTASVNICSNTPYTIPSGNATATNYSSITWTENGSGSITSGANTLTPTYTPSIGETGAVVLTLTAYGNAPCADAVDTRTLNITPAPTATAGIDATICSSGTYNITDAVAANYASVLWTENGTGSLTAGTTMSPTYNPSVGESDVVTLNLHVNGNGTCADVDVQQTLTVIPMPTANAGTANVNICSNTPYTILSGNATATNYTSILWTKNGGATGAITNAATLTPTYTPSVGETGVVTLTLTANGATPCGSAADTRTLTITPAPTATAGIDATICSSGTYNITDAVAANYLSVLWSEDGTGSLTGANTMSPTYNPSVGESDVVTLNLHVNGNGTCADIDVQQSLTVIPAATANAGAATGSTCNNIPFNVTGATATNNTSVLWTHNGTGNLSGATTLAPTYTPGVGETGSVTLVLTAYGAAPCGNATDNTVLTISARPNFTTAQTNVSCFGGYNGTITVTATVGSTPFDFSKNGGTNYTSNQTSPFIFSTLSAAAYSVVVRDNNGCVSLPQTVTITQPVTGLSTTAINGGPYSLGQNITLTASPAGGTLAYGYSWSGPASFTSAVGPATTRPSATVAMAGIYKVTVTDANGCTASAQTTVNVYAGTVWTGAFDTDWHNPLNWSPANVPDLCVENVVITNVTNKPIVSTTVNVGNVTMNIGGQVTLNADLGVCGKWTGNTGAVVLGNNSVVFNGSLAQSITGNTKFTNVRLDNSAGATVIGGASQITNALELKTGTFTVNAATYLTFTSTSATQCAVIDNFSAGMNGTIVGAVKMQRYYNAPTSPTYKTQHYMGSPANAAAYTLFGANGTEGYVINTTCDELKSSSGSPTGTMAQYEENAPGASTCDLQGWKIVKTGNTENGRGYSVSRTGAGTMTISGSPNLANSYTRTGLTNSNWTNTTLQGHIDTSGWHLLSNPWLANLELSNASGGAGMDNQVAVWQTTGAYAGGYKYYQKGFDVIDIAPFQAFLVHKTAVGGTSLYTINGSDRKRTPSSVLFQSQSNDQQLAINVDNTNGLTDRTVIAFNSDATNSFDPIYDGNKLWGDPARQSLYTENNGMPMARNTLASINTTSTVPMGFDCGTNGTFTMNFEGINTFDATSYITLEDRKTNTWHDVRNGNYVFAADTNDNLNRFVIHFTPAAEITKTDATCNAAGTINVIQPGTAIWNYTVANSNSVVVSSGSLNINSPITLNVPTGVYSIALVDNNNYTVVKQVQVNGAQQVTASFTASATVVEQDDNIQFNSTATNATNNNWNFGDNVTATGITATHSYTTPGNYTATLTANNTDCNAVNTQQITVTAKAATGISNLTDSKSIAIWSSENTVYVDMSKQPKVEATIEIYNVLGQQLSNEKFGRSTIYSKAFTNLEAAYVIVRVKNNEEIITKKVFIANGK